MSKLCITILLCLIAGTAWGQEWQEYQLTNLPNSSTVRQCEATADSAGNIHAYLVVTLQVQPSVVPMFYMRVSPYGNLLTDTVRLNTAQQYSTSTHTAVTGDGQGRAWCVWSENHSDGQYIAGRNANGEEILPMTYLGWGGGGGPPDDGLDAIYTTDEIIHIIKAGRYDRITTDGDVLIYSQLIPEAIVSAHPRINRAPDGTVWAIIRADYSDIGTDLLFLRFGADTLYEAFYPLGYQDGQHWGLSDFKIDVFGNFHCLVYHDTAIFSYCLLDSNLLLQDWHTFIQSGWTSPISSLGVDSEGNSIVVWGDEAEDEIHWALRTIDGDWEPEESLAQDSVYGFGYWPSVINTGIGHWVMVGNYQKTIGQLPSDLFLLTYGYPSSISSNEAPTRIVQLTAYPNPFNSSLQLLFPARTIQSIAVYNVLGRLVFEHAVSPDRTTLSFDNHALNILPSGVFFVYTRGGLSEPLKIIHNR